MGQILNPLNSHEASFIDWLQIIFAIAIKILNMALAGFAQRIEHRHAD